MWRVPLEEAVKDDCAQCEFRAGRVCSLWLGESDCLGKPIDRLVLKVKARQTFARSRTPGRPVVVVRSGWAATVHMLPDGRRQILSVVLPGETLTCAGLLDEEMTISAVALSDLECCVIEADLSVAADGRCRNLQDIFAQLCRDEFQQMRRRLVDLGRRTSEERIASFILDIMRRQEALGAAKDGRFPFLIRQQDLADALGLTQVHASRVMSNMRRAGLIEFSRNEMAVLDADALNLILS
ncbi:Crp/Fnr family transcriptional regulator [Hyphobacterium sp. SN044]|uniref:Crp/Fnr family transcriptional regulator n=1 Tax=Hyphobacterium sp. SN044 TaxID=2912575 RepID=UPI001F1779DD|nr:Crp/Fnr family transcriptional regulator [Hyphobacterium sp. SN044]MCF8880102.1 Crp/Fnr family transcriptional regulator [Hyphobacterium sp. SN044]